MLEIGSDGQGLSARIQAVNSFLLSDEFLYGGDLILEV